MTVEKRESFEPINGMVVWHGKYGMALTLKVYCSQISVKCKEYLGRESPKYFMF